MASNSFSFVTSPVKSSFSLNAYTLNSYVCVSPFGGHGPSYPISPKSFMPCAVPSAKVASFEIPLLMPCPVGMLKITQCTHGSPFASGSSTIIAMPCVFSGKFEIDNCGERLSPSHVYSLGIFSLSRNASLVIVSSVVVSVFDWQDEKMSVATISGIIFFIIIVFV